MEKLLVILEAKISNILEENAYNILYNKYFVTDNTVNSHGERNSEYIMPEDNEGRDILVYNSDGIFAAIYRYQEDIHGWKAYKMFL